MEDQLVSLVV